MSELLVLDSEPVDTLGRLYRSVRDITRNAEVSQADKISVLELVKHEILTDLNEEIRQADES